MRWNFVRWRVFCFAFVTLLAAPPLHAQSASHFDLSWNTIDSGGADSRILTISVDGTIGQPDAGGPMRNGALSISGGFWTTAAAPPPRIDLSSGAARPGGVACIGATLTANGVPVAATTNDAGFDAGQFTLDTCTVNPAIGPATAANKTLTPMSLSPGDERLQVDGNANVIPDGPLYTCQFTVAAGATIGAQAVTNVPAAADPGGTPLAAVAGSAGQIIVTACTGDCNGDGHVTIGEVTRCVSLFLGQPLCNLSNSNLSCPVADASLNGSVSIGEVSQCVNRFLNGC
jgi:hypothetical protein